MHDITRRVSKEILHLWSRLADASGYDCSFSLSIQGVANRNEFRFTIMDDLLIIGGGVVGLSLAYDLAGRGKRVRILDRADLGRESSWAGAGIFPPPALLADLGPAYAKLAELSFNLQAAWSEQLLDQTGIDNEFQRCGGWYLELADADEADRKENSQVQQAIGRSTGKASGTPTISLSAGKASGTLASETLSPAEFAAREPAMAELALNGKRYQDSVGNALRGIPEPPLISERQEFQQQRGTLPTEIPPRRLTLATFIPDECQLRNPRHIKALIEGCRLRGVAFETNVEVTGFWSSAGHLVGAQTSAGPHYATNFCITSGAYSGRLAEQLDLQLPVKPIRGQIVLFKAETRLLKSIVYVGRRYLVPRNDGHILVGSTLEDVGFDRRNTDEAVVDLTEFAWTMLPALREASIVRTWAGLRPASADGLPYLGRVPGLANAFIATGHYRSGLYLAPATAVVMSQLIRGETPEIALDDFRAGR